MPAFLNMAAGCGIALAASAGLTSVTIRVCRKYGCISRPRPDRWHCGRPAFYGGVPIWLGFLAVSLWLFPISALAWKIIGLSTLMFGVGLADDLYHLRARQKLVLQIGVASLALAAGMKFRIFDNVIVDGALSLFWIIGITNSFNLLDNMDGLSPGVALITSLFLAIYFLQSGDGTFFQITLVLAGSVAGFLLFNYYPARIFMGDCGSLFLGFILASLSLVWAVRGGSPSSGLLSLLILFGVPVVDTFSVSVTRRLRDRPSAKAVLITVPIAWYDSDCAIRGQSWFYVAPAACVGLSSCSHAVLVRALPGRRRASGH
jgi:UDP-GlcNAc:undecaprenyl-phosphate/decaprenyl-phosphate GlcNAc-1-phosphate transferase